jgi:hypothetical protein
MLEAGDAAGPQDFLSGAVLLIARLSVWVFRVDSFFFSLSGEEFFLAGVGFLILRCRRIFQFFFSVSCGEVCNLVSIGSCFVCCVVFVVVFAAAVGVLILIFWVLVCGSRSSIASKSVAGF